MGITGSPTVTVGNTSLVVTGDFYPATQPISGNVGITGSPTFTVGNTSIDTHCYASSNGTSWHHLKSDANGILNVHSMTQDGAGNDITSSTFGTGSERALNVSVKSGTVNASLYSGTTELTTTSNGTKNGLDCNIINSSAISTQDGRINSAYDATNTAIKVNMVAGSITSVNIKDSVGSNILVDGSSTNNLKTVDKNVALSYNSTALGVQTVNKLLDGSTYRIGTCDANGYQNVNVKNTVAVSGTFYPSLQQVAIDQTENNNKVSIQGVTVNEAFGGCLQIADPSVSYFPIPNTILRDGMDTNAFLQAFDRTPLVNANTLLSATQISADANIRALDTYSHTACVNSASGNLNQITSTIISSGVIPEQLSHKCMDTFIRNGSTDVINYGQTNVFGSFRTGINMYQIYPKKIHYTLSGRTESAAQSVIMGGTGSQKFIYDFTFGKATAQTFSAILGAGSGSPRNLRYHYVDSLGDLKTDGSITINATTAVTLLPLNIISVNKFWINGSVGLSEQVLIRVGAANTAINTIASADNNDYYNGVVTIPNGYIGYLSQFSVYSPSAIWFQVQKWDETSIRSVVYSHFNGANAPVCSGANGSIGMIFTAGESVCFSKDASGSSTVTGNIVLEPI